MEITQYYLTSNNCYRASKKHVPKGIMIHSTGANNPNLRRYVGPDDGILGRNPNGNDWNRPKPDGIEICAHAFIGLDKFGEVRIYQTLPWDYVCWLSGKGANGTANFMGYIGFEICEDGRDDPVYFAKIYKATIELCAFLCQKYGIDTANIIDHYLGSKMGIASAHVDVNHWFPLFGKQLEDVRRDVKGIMSGPTPPEVLPEEPPKPEIPELPNEPNAPEAAVDPFKKGRGKRTKNTPPERRDNAPA